MDMTHTYTLTCDLASLAQDIGQTLKENHSSTVIADRTQFAGKDSCCQIDTYQIYALNERGYITVNVYFFRPEMTGDHIQVKVSLFSPLWNESSMKMRKLEKEICGVISARMA